MVNDLISFLISEVENACNDDPVGFTAELRKCAFDCLLSVCKIKNFSKPKIKFLINRFPM